jgi:hypothetical protein
MGLILTGLMIMQILASGGYLVLLERGNIKTPAGRALKTGLFIVSVLLLAVTVGMAVLFAIAILLSCGFSYCPDGE